MMKEDEIKERLGELLAFSCLSKGGFAKKCSLDATSFTKMLSGEHNITIRTIEKICAAFPEINYNWLLRGNGDMLKSSSAFIHQSGDNNTAVGHNSTVNSADALVLAINELSAQRRVTEKAQEQIDRLLGLLEKKHT